MEEMVEMVYQVHQVQMDEMASQEYKESLVHVDLQELSVVEWCTQDGGKDHVQIFQGLSCFTQE